MMHVIHATEETRHVKLDVSACEIFIVLFLVMSLLTSLEEASEATRAAISFLQYTDNVHELLQGNALCIVHCAFLYFVL